MAETLLALLLLLAALAPFMLLPVVIVGLVVLLMLVLFCSTRLICMLVLLVFLTAVSEMLGESSFSCFDMLVVPGGDEVGIICISDVDLAAPIIAPTLFAGPEFVAEAADDEDLGYIMPMLSDDCELVLALDLT